MLRRKNIAWPLALVFVMLLADAFAQRRGGGNGTIVSIGPAIGFYRLNTRHAVDPSSRMSALASLRYEIRADRGYRTFIQLGAEYFIHGVNYHSYYFTQDTLQLYDKTFGYRYGLYLQEINLPLQLKILFSRGDNKLYSPYAIVAYHLRYLVQSQVEVTESGYRVRKDFPAPAFRNFLLHERMNAYISTGLGWQRNKISDRGAAFFAELTFRYGFSDYLFRRDYAASAVYINSTHLALSLGLKL